MFTDKYLKSLKPEESKYYRREGGGFAVRVMPSGVKTWLFIYSFDGKRREMTLGSYPDVSLATARERHAEAKKLLNNGIDPGAVKREAKLERERTPFVADFVREYINRYAKLHNRAWKEIERSLNKEIVPAWGARKMTDVRRRDLVGILDRIVDRGAPIMANRVLAHTRKLFSYAVQRDVLEVNPFLGMNRPGKERARDRVLTSQEIRTFWEDLEQADMSDQVKRALKLILVTAQRPGEVMGMHRREIDGSWWTIPVERSKNKQAHRVFLTPLALELVGDHEGFILESPAYRDSDPEGGPISKHYELQTVSRDLRAHLESHLAVDAGDRPKVAYFTPHDLRRTAATCMAEMGVPGDILDRVQNHITREKQGVGHVYNRYSYDREKQQALEAWERKLTSILTGKQGNVLPFIRKPVEL